MDKNEKTCPYCGARSPLGTPCSAECEENHAKFHARAVWHKRFLYITVAVSLLCSESLSCMKDGTLIPYKA